MRTTSACRIRPRPTVPGSAFAWNFSYDGTQYYGSLTFVIALSP
jgi:hypothetical protein